MKFKDQDKELIRTWKWPADFDKHVDLNKVSSTISNLLPSRPSNRYLTGGSPIHLYSRTCSPFLAKTVMMVEGPHSKRPTRNYEETARSFDWVDETNRFLTCFVAL